MSRVATLLTGVVIGVVVFGVVRLLALPPVESTHYHANWAVWIDGARVDLSHERYMEDVASCSADASNMTAHARVHMHEGNMDVVHVHHAASSWGHLLQNIEWGMGADWLFTDDGLLYRDGDGGRRLTFVLNGLIVPPVHDRVIQPGDRLLISFGAEDPSALLEERFPTVSSDAPDFDGSYDPAGCAGTPTETFGERVRRSFWF